MFIRRKKLPFNDRVKEAVSPRRGYARSWRYIVWRLKRLPGTPEYIATGFAIGVGINFWPFLFTHLVTAYILCRILKGDVIAMFIGTFFGNPWTFAVVYPAMYKIGKVLLGLHPRPLPHSMDTAHEVMNQIWPIKSWESFVTIFHEIIVPMMLGGFLLGLPCVIFSYILAKRMVYAYHIQRRRAMLKKEEAEQ